MSRYSRHIEGCEVAVGWDPLARSYFGEVCDPEAPPHDQVTLRVGRSPQELPDVESLEAAMPYGTRKFVQRVSLELYGDRGRA